MRTFWTSQKIYFERFSNNDGQRQLSKGSPFDLKKIYVFLSNTDQPSLRKVWFFIIFCVLLFHFKPFILTFGKLCEYFQTQNQMSYDKTKKSMFLFICAQASHIFTVSTMKLSQNFDSRHSKTYQFQLLEPPNGFFLKTIICSDTECSNAWSYWWNFAFFSDEFSLRFWTTKTNSSLWTSFWIGGSAFAPRKHKREVSSFQIFGSTSSRKFSKLAFFCVFWW